MVAAGNTIPNCLLQAILPCTLLKSYQTTIRNYQSKKMVIELTGKSVWCLHFIMNLGCTLGFVPFSWNSKTKRLEHTSKCKLVIFYFFALYAAWTWLYMSIQLVRLSSIKDVPPRIRIMNIIWGLTFCLIFLCKVQFITRKNEIKGFANELLGSICVKKSSIMSTTVNKFPNNDNVENGLELGLIKFKTPKILRNFLTNHRAASKIQKRKKKKENIDWIAIIIYFSTYLLIVNPPSHAVLIFDMPCAPQYISSLIFPCHWIGDRPVPAIEIIPFVLWENLIFMNVMSICAFYWSLIFLGLLWIKCELKSQMAIDQQSSALGESNSKGRDDNNDDLHNIAFLYRKAQLMTILINHSFHLYLQYFPSLLFVIAGTLVFSTIRFTHLPFHIFIVFPACSFRCLFEASTQLEVAASLNLQSHHYLEYLSETIAKKKALGSASPNEEDSDQEKKLRTMKMIRYLVTFKKSCRKLTCSSGSLYTFEKTIVLVSWHCCTQLVFNLLVAFPEAKETNWGNAVSPAAAINQTIISSN